MTELRPDEPDYPARLRRIREQLDMGLTVYVDHCEFGTSKKLVLVRATALAREGSFPPSYVDYVLVTWLYTGAMWYPLNSRPDSGYVIEKMKTPNWDLDAQSIVALMMNLANVGSDEPLVTAREVR
jgi:hypothetical protein